MQESYLFVCQVAGLGAHGIIPYLTKFLSQLPAQLFSVESMRHCVLHYQSICSEYLLHIRAFPMQSR